MKVGKITDLIIISIFLVILFDLSLAETNLVSNSPFKVVGTKIYDPNGNEFIAHGINVNGPGYGWWGNTPAAVDDIVKRWKFNAIRVAVREIEPVEWIDENGSIEQIVELYTQHNVVVVLTPHEQTGYYFTGRKLKKLENWWRRQSRKYKDNPYVWFNVSNEPGGFDSSQPKNVAKWLNQNQRVIDAIRSQAANNIIMVDAHYWGQDVGEWNANLVKKFQSSLLSYASKLSDPQDNLVFSVHLYDQWQFSQAKMENYFDRVQTANIPLIIGEYGSKTDGSYKKVVSWVLNLAGKKRIGLFAWAWAGQDDFDLTTSDNGGGQHSQYDLQGNAINLSWFGEKVWRHNRRIRNESSTSIDDPR